MRFSDRIGITESKDILQVDSIDRDLLNCLWEACTECHLKRYNNNFDQDTTIKFLLKNIYVDFFKKSSDNVPGTFKENMSILRKWFFSANWWDVYNFIEFLIEAKQNQAFVNRVNYFLEREKSGYRVVNNQIAPITSPVEIESVSAASTLTKDFGVASEHIRTAVSLFSKKPDPDYRNSIKEAISAVESAVIIITGNSKATLGDALKKIDAKISLHPAFKEAMSKLYGYTSAEGGIRHALIEDGLVVDEADAKFMIVTCSAFVNFCVQKVR
jgi:hypothetical protein